MVFGTAVYLAGCDEGRNPCLCGAETTGWGDLIGAERRCHASGRCNSATQVVVVSFTIFERCNFTVTSQAVGLFM